MVDENIKLQGNVTIYLRNSFGEIKETREIKNLVVSSGLAFICSRMVGTSANVMSHMAVGSSATATSAGQTDVVSILGSRKTLDSSSESANTVTYVSSFEAGEGTGTITEAGIFNASSGGAMLCRTVFTALTKAADDTLTIKWVLTLSTT